MLRRLYSALLFTLFLSAFAAEAQSPLEKKIPYFDNNKKYERITPEQLEEVRKELADKEEAFRQVANNFDSQLLQLQQQLNQSKQPLTITNEPINEQLKNSHDELMSIKENSDFIANELQKLNTRNAQIKRELNEVKEAYNQHKTLTINQDSQNYERLKEERLYLKQAIQTLIAEQDTQNERQHIMMLRQNLANAQQEQMKRHIDELNDIRHEKRSLETEEAIKKSLPDDNKNEQATSLTPLIRQNHALGIELKHINNVIDNATVRQKRAEEQYQSQAKQLIDIKEQINWLRADTAFGENLLRQLKKLSTPPPLKEVEKELANIQVTKYEYEQSLNQLGQKLEDGSYAPGLLPFLVAQRDLLQQLIEGYSLATIELARLKLKYTQVSEQNKTLKELLNEHLFWIRNTNAINFNWFQDVWTSAQWLIHTEQWSNIRIDSNDNILWYAWMILTTLILAIRDLTKAPYYQYLSLHGQYIGHVRQDNFNATFRTLFISLFYAFLIPMIPIGAGYICYESNNSFMKAFGFSVMLIGVLFLIYSLFKHLALQNGLLVKHFSFRYKVIHQIQKNLLKFGFISLPLLSIIAFTDTYDSSFLKNNLGRAAFILWTIFLFRFYFSLYKINKQSAFLEQKFSSVWKVACFVPLACTYLAAYGYYYTSFQVLWQLQISVFIAFGFYLVYLLIHRLMLIQRRKISYERAKQKRAEQLALLEKGQAHSDVQLSDESNIEVEAPEIDLDAISKQSLQLIKTLLTVAFFLSLIALWTQTKDALLSILDDFPLWETTTIIDGIQQTQPVTLKAALIFIFIILMSMLLVKNLPSLLELIILQKIELNRGTSFAVTTVTRYILIIMGVALAFNYLGISWSNLQWLVTALALGLGFGLQEIFANFMSGLIILFEKPIRIGDTVTIRDLTGTISKIQIRATTIIDWDRKEIIVPNKAFITEQLINWSLSDPITRIIVNVRVARDSDPSLVEALLHQAIQECDFALPNPKPEIWFSEFGEHTQNYEVRAYAQDLNERWPLKHQLHKVIHKKFHENHIVLSYPQLEVHFQKAPEAPSDMISHT